jgi:hypothetical protein
MLTQDKPEFQDKLFKNVVYKKYSRIEKLLTKAINGFYIMCRVKQKIKIESFIYFNTENNDHGKI